MLEILQRKSPRGWAAAARMLDTMKRTTLQRIQTATQVELAKIAKARWKRERDIGTTDVEVILHRAVKWEDAHADGPPEPLPKPPVRRDPIPPAPNPEPVEPEPPQEMTGVPMQDPWINPFGDM